MNKVILLGRIGKDPELRYTQSGQGIASFSLATTKKWTKDGEKKEKTEWHSLKVWGKPAEIVKQYVRKGDMLLVEGELNYGEYEKDGIKRYTTDINVSNFEFMPKSNSDAPKQGPVPQTTQPAMTYTNDQIPF